MYAQKEKPKENKSRAVANSVAQKKSDTKQGFGFVDNRQEAIAQRQLQEMVNDNPKIIEIRNFQKAISRSDLTEARQAQSTHDVVQLVEYTAMNPKRGVRAMVKITHNGNCIDIEDKTQTDQNVGELSGYVTYRINDKELWLDHIETHPPGMGLGALLMYELALLAEQEGCEKIPISMPAHTAVGAYLHFGAESMNLQNFTERFGQFYNLYSNKDNEEELEYKVKEDMDEKIKHKIEMERYFNPTMTEEEEQQHKDRFKLEEFNKLGEVEEEAVKHAQFRALSNTGLCFDTKALKDKTKTTISQRWSEARIGDFELIENYF